MIEATLHTDAGCPWAYSANPALRVLEWRFRDQLSWRLVMIGLREQASEAAVRTYDPERALMRYRFYGKRYGMPFGLTAKARPSGTGRGCRAVVAAGLLEPGSEWRVFRALQLANFTTSLYLDDAESIGDALRTVPGIRADDIVARIDDDEVVDEYERQRAEACSAAGTPAEAQGKTATSNGLVRFTAPSIVFRKGEGVGRRGRLATAARLRRRPREPRPRPRTRATTGVAGVAPGLLRRRADDSRGRALARGRAGPQCRHRGRRGSVVRPRGRA